MLVSQPLTALIDWARRRGLCLSADGDPLLDPRGRRFLDVDVRLVVRVAATKVEDDRVARDIDGLGLRGDGPGRRVWWLGAGNRLLGTALQEVKRNRRSAFLTRRNLRTRTRPAHD